MLLLHNLIQCHPCSTERVDKILDDFWQSLDIDDWNRPKLLPFNPLAYTDVPETAGLARSINP